MNETLYHLLERSGGGSFAVEDARGRTPGDMVRAKVRSLAHGLRELGIRPEDRVAVMLDHTVDRVVALFAIAGLGAVSVPINRRLRSLQLAHIVRDCGVRVVIGDAPLLRELVPVLPELSCVELVIERRELDALSCAPTGPFTGRGSFDFDALCALPPTFMPAAEAPPLAMILYTSGSTGLPKGVMLGHAQLIAGGEIAVREQSMGPDDRLLGLLELSNIAGMQQLLAATVAGATLVLQTYSPFDDLAAVFHDARITGLSLTPSQVAAFQTRADDFRGRSFTQLRFIVCGGGVLDRAHRRALVELFPTTTIWIAYGLTEAVRSATALLSITGDRIECIGSAVAPSQLLVVDEELQPVSAGTAGEILVCGPTVALGYWKRDEETARTFVNTPHGRALRTGDLGRVDADGSVLCLGRRDLVIKSAGHRISPLEIESVLLNAPGVTAAGVVGAPDALLGQSIHAFVVTDRPLTVHDLVRWCRATLPAYMVPASIAIVSELPTTAVGKVDYPALRARVAG